MAFKTISSLSREYVRVRVVQRNQGVPVDPTQSTVQLAFMRISAGASAAPGDTDWVSGSWETEAGPDYFARALVGPGGDSTIAAGKYQVWVKIAPTSGSEQPVRSVGVLTVF